MKDATAITLTINILQSIAITKNTITTLQSSTGQIQLLNRTKLFSESSAVTSTPLSELLYVKGNNTLVHAH